MSKLIDICQESESLGLVLLALIVEEVFGYLHPELFLQLFVIWLVSILLSHVDISTLESYLDCLVKVVEDCKDDDLSLLHHSQLVNDFFLLSLEAFKRFNL